ncbi:hypothetical protein NH340_JMT05825 [Sarcoptes scabiei]|nr:hypothetical protein NH340_JMT05825 [Sarcoptes scabiei]
MKIDRTKSKKSSSEVPFDCKLLIEELESTDRDHLLAVLKRNKTWNCGKCELYHWIDVLDIFDSILEECCQKSPTDQWTLNVDLSNNQKNRELLLAVISFTSLLIEHSFSRHLYSSIEHLITLLSSTDMQIVLAILNLLFVFSKRSNFFSRISSENRQTLLSRLFNLAENWGGKDQGFGLAQCCQDLPITSFPSNVTTFNFEFYDNKCPKGKENHSKTKIVRIKIENVHLIDKSISVMMAELIEKFKIPVEHQMQIFTQLRLIKNFVNYHTRLQCVQARLNALSIMVYCQAMAVQDTFFQLLYSGIIEELVEVLELKNPDLIEIKSASLKTLTSIIHLDRNSKLKIIIECTGANSYHGFLPSLVRNCINALIAEKMHEYPLSFVTALFSFLYHLASYESGCEALVQCGIMESLLRVVNWKGSEMDHITFVTRSVRVIDLLTNQFIDMNAFQSNNGLNIFVQRLEYEVNICRTEKPYEIEVQADKNKSKNSIHEDDFDEKITSKSNELSETPMEIEMDIDSQHNSLTLLPSKSSTSTVPPSLQCYPQRAALLKSMLNFMKKAVQCTGFSENIRPLMYGNFPKSLRHMISNAEYYGSSLFLLATDVVSVYVYQEPSLLSVIQDNGLADVVLHALLIKNVPPTKEVLASLPTVFTSLCLNHRGLDTFVSLQPFEKIFKIFLSPEYLQAMRRRRSESINDTATCLGNAMDELIRHQPSLRTNAIGAIIKLLEEICTLGSDPKYICTKAVSKVQENSSQTFNLQKNKQISTNVNNDSSSSEEEEEYDDDATATTAENASTAGTNNENEQVDDLNQTNMVISSVVEDNDIQPTKISTNSQNTEVKDREQIPLIDYILNVTRFVDAILSNNSTDDHCKEFLNQKGLEPLFQILQLPNLPLDFPILPACYSISSVFKSLLNLAHEKTIFSRGLEKLKDILDRLEPITKSSKTFNGSILLEDLITHLNSKKNSSVISFVTPMLQSLAAVHAYIMTFIHICRTGQGDIRMISVQEWGSDLGIEIIEMLSNLYIALVWESTILLGLNDTTTQKYDFVKSQLEKMNVLMKNNQEIDNAMSPMEIDLDNEMICFNCGNRPECSSNKSGKQSQTSQPQSCIKSQWNGKAAHHKCIKPLITVASRLGRALAELFGLLVKLSIGLPIRNRRNHHQPNFPSHFNLPTLPAQRISKHLNKLLARGLSWKPSFKTDVPKIRLTFFVCSIGFSSPMLFDDRKFPYHLMLKNFVLSNGLESFFECYETAIKTYSFDNESYHIIVDFLHAWLVLLEKLANPQRLLETPHVLTPSKNNDIDHETEFDPIQYLIRVHRLSYSCILDLWVDKLEKINCKRVLESLITVFSHIITGEKLIEKHLKSKSKTILATSESSQKTVENPDNNDNLVSFTDAQADQPQQQQHTEGASSSSSLPNTTQPAQAPEHAGVRVLIEMGFPPDLALDAFFNVGDDVTAAADWILANHSLSLNSVNEEDDMIKAIALSLLDSSGGESDEKIKKEKICHKNYHQLIPLTSDEMNRLMDNILAKILILIDQVPEIVNKCCELMVAFSNRNGKEWFEEIINNLIIDTITIIEQLNKKTFYKQDNDSGTTTDWSAELSTSKEAIQLSSRIHLLLVLYNEAKKNFSQEAVNPIIIDQLISLLENSSYLLNVSFEKQSTITTPKWIAPAVLFIDLYEHYAVALDRRNLLLAETMNAKRVWKYFEDRAQRWNSYQPDINKSIDDSFRNGELYKRINANRRKYTINFGSMVQINDETCNLRPVMLFIEPDKPTVNSTIKNEMNERDLNVEREKPNQENDFLSKKIDDEYESKKNSKTSVATSYKSIFKLLNSKQSKSLIESSINLFKIPIEPETLNAILRLNLRLTRNYENASYFVEKNGVNLLLKIPQSSVFCGFVSLVILIIRHVLEDEKSLQTTMERLICNFNQNSNSSHEVNYQIRFYSPAACRNANLFKISAKNLFRFNVPVPSNSNRRSNSENTLRTDSKLSLDIWNNADKIPKPSKDVISDLLNMLPMKYAQQQQRKNAQLESGCLNEKSEEKCKDVFHVHTVLSILDELTRSYHIVAKLICEFNYPIGLIESMVECSAISFILNKLLSHNANYGDKDCATYSRALLASIASVPFTPEVHHTLFNEIKSALKNTILLPESVEKHAKIQAMMTLIAMFEMPSSLIHPYRANNFTNSSFFKLLVKKNLAADVAKLINHMDLSSPMISNTINTLLKTLEILSKNHNYPNNLLGSRHQQSQTQTQQHQQEQREREESQTQSETIFPLSLSIIDLDATASIENDSAMEQDGSINLSTNQQADRDNVEMPVNIDSTSLDNIASESMISLHTSNANEDESSLDGEMFHNLQTLSFPARENPAADDEFDDEEDDVQDVRNVIVNATNEMHDNTVNSNCVESSSSEETSSDEDSEENDDVELEEDADGAGSTQDDHEDEEDDEHLDEDDDEDEDDDDDEEEIVEDYATLHALLDEPLRTNDNNEYVFNLDEVLPHVFNVRDRVPSSSAYVIPYPSNDDVTSNSQIPDITAINSNIQIHHPLLSHDAENIAAISSMNDGILPSRDNFPIQYVNTRPNRVNRHRTMRSYLQANDNWQISTFQNRNYSSQILQRLLGTTSNVSDLLPSHLRQAFEFEPRDDSFDFNQSINYLNPLNPLAPNYTQSIPNTMSRWYEEARILDGQFMSDSMLLIKQEILEFIEKIRDREIQELKKKEKTQTDDAEKIKKVLSDNSRFSVSSDRQQSDSSNDRIDEIHAHIEQLTTSVINQVLETNTLANSSSTEQSSEQSVPASARSESVVALESLPDELLTIQSNEGNQDISTGSNAMEVVTEEEPIVEESMIPNNAISDVATVNEINVEFMDQSAQHRQAMAITTASVPPISTAEESVVDVNLSDSLQQQSNTQEQQQSSQNIPNTNFQLTAEERAILGDQELPEGVDPSFLAALPENIRQEVIAEQFRLQRLNNLRTLTTANQSNASSSNAVQNAEVSPEFLAALPPNIQEEVLAQQRAEQQRLNAQNTNPDAPVDPVSFLNSLPPTLRRQVLTDLDDSQVQLLPPDLANEARSLRRDYEMRNRQMHERFFTTNNTISRIIRSAANSRVRYDPFNFQNLRLSFAIRGGSYDRDNFQSLTRNVPRPLTNRSFKGKHLLDFDGLASVMILLFLNENVINVIRLQRLIKNLCYHQQSRQWVIQSLLEIIKNAIYSADNKSHFIKPEQSNRNFSEKQMVSWNSIYINSSFGSKTKVFCANDIDRDTNKLSPSVNSYSIIIHPQVSFFVCKNVLDMMIILAKTFPDQFIHNIVSTKKNSTQFFDTLLRQDFIMNVKRSKSRTDNQITKVGQSSKPLELSPLTQLLNLLSSPFVKKNRVLTDRLIRLVGFIITSFIRDQPEGQRNQQPIDLSNEIKEKLKDIEQSISDERLLKLVVDVLITKPYSTEGISDSSALIVKLCNLFPSCRSILYKFLLEGVRNLGEIVYKEINTLIFEMKDLLIKIKSQKTIDTLDSTFEKTIKGKSNIQDRYSKMTIIVKSQSNLKQITGKEVQLPSMSNLISKSSSQFLFCRILKIILHIRENNAKAQQSQAAKNSSETSMEVDNEDKLCVELQLDHLWEKLSECLTLLSEAPDDHVVLVLQPAVESFFLVHAQEKSKNQTKANEPVNVQVSHINQAGQSEVLATDSNVDNESRQYGSLPFETQKFLIFAEKHRVVLNQILRQSNVHLMNGPFSVLVDHTRILDFDVKRRYFRQELERLDQNIRRDDLPVHIRREHIFEDSYRELHRRTCNDWKNRFYVVFEGEEGQDAGGLLREWYTIISREIFNPNYALFTTSPGDRVTYMINSASHCNSNHLSYFKFVGRVISKAIYDNKLLDCYFTRSFYKHILGKAVKYTDMESEDYAFYQGLVFLLEHNVNELGTELTFSLEIQEFGVTEIRDLVPDGRNIIVTEENKHEYVKLVCQEKMTGSIKKQLHSFLEGFYEIIPKHLISIFNEHELELLISGLPTIDIDDLKANTEYHKYQINSLQIQWFWRALRTFDQADRAKFLQFVTGTSKVPLQGFSALEGMNGPQKFQIHLDDRSTDRLPSAHTCFNQLDLPSYETYDKLRIMLLKAIHECSEGFGFA